MKYVAELEVAAGLLQGSAGFSGQRAQHRLLEESGSQSSTSSGVVPVKDTFPRETSVDSKNFIMQKYCI